MRENASPRERVIFGTFSLRSSMAKLRDHHATVSGADGQSARATKRLLGLVAGRSEKLAQKPQRVWFELDELQPDVEASDCAGR